MPSLKLQSGEEIKFTDPNAFRLALVILMGKGMNPKLDAAFTSLHALRTGAKDEETEAKINKCIKILRLFLHPDKSGQLIGVCQALFDTHGYGIQNTGFADADGLVNDVFKSTADLAEDRKQHEVQSTVGTIKVPNAAVITFQAEVTKFIGYLKTNPDAKLFSPPVKKATSAGVEGYDLSTVAGRKAAAEAAKLAAQQSKTEGFVSKTGATMHRAGSNAAMDAQKEHHKDAASREEAAILKQVSQAHGGVPMYPIGSDAAKKAANATHKKLDTKAQQEAARRAALDTKPKVKSTAAFDATRLAEEAKQEQRRRAESKKGTPLKGSYRNRGGSGDHTI